MAREWGYTTNENPFRGIRKNEEKPRDFYADKAVWDAVYRHASVELQDAMDLNYLTGHRPADVLKMADPDINNEALLVRQAKTRKLLRIMLYEGEIKSELANVIERIQTRPRRKGGLSSYRYRTASNSTSRICACALTRPKSSYTSMQEGRAARPSRADRVISISGYSGQIRKRNYRRGRCKRIAGPHGPRHYESHLSASWPVG